MPPIISLFGRVMSWDRAITRTRARKRWTNVFLLAGSLAYGSSLTACNDLVANPSLPDGVQSPNTYNSLEGALELTRATVVLFKEELVDVMIASGLLTDELSNSSASTKSLVDIRDLQEQTFGAGSVFSPLDQSYQHLHRLRGQARQARGVIAKYAPTLSHAVRGQLYAIEAYAEVLLADIYCSGVPLSTLDFEKDFTYKPSSTTAEVYEHAIALFDTALTLVADSANLETLARVGKGRALLALGRYDDAAQAVASVTEADAYRTRITFYQYGVLGTNDFAAEATVSDLEGQNGLPYRSSGDPRTASDTAQLRVQGTLRLVYLPNKYRGNDSVMFTLADGIEAKLIQAEAALKRGETGSWLQMLNQLRTTGEYSGIDTTFQIDTVEGVIDTSIVRVDTLWIAGTGGVAKLGPLQDPATPEARIDLMFAERAAWLFVTAHRQGDLRRLIRQYDRAQERVYPTGSYTNLGGSPTGLYGDHITAPIPAEERRNPHFRGCLSRD